MARLDHLGAAKEVAQVGAVIGSEFSYELLHAVHPIADQELQRALRILADAELIYVRGIAPEASYQFKHALIRDAAYEALLRSRRKDLHRLVARTIDEKFTALKEAHPEVLARHWTEAGATEPAIGEWSRAGEAARVRNAFSEALESYQQALALLNLLPESPERDLRELELRQSVVQMLQVMRGYAAPETREATERGAALAEKSGNLTQLLNWVGSRFINAHDAGDIPAASALADQALELALREGSPASLGFAHAAQTLIRHWRGDLVGVEQHFTTGLKFFDDSRFRSVPGAATGTFGYATMNAWALGRTEVARERMARVAAGANANNPYEVAWSGMWAAHLRVLMREHEKAEALAAVALELAEKNQFLLIAAYSRCVLGQARAELGRATEGVELIRQGIAGLLRSGGSYTSPVSPRLSQRRRRAKVPSSKRLPRSNRRSRRVPPNSQPGLGCSGHAVNCGSNRGRPNWPRPTSARRSRSHRRWARKRGNCARPRASRDCCAIPAAATQRARCSPKSTAGSPRASTPRT